MYLLYLFVFGTKPGFSLEIQILQTTWFLGPHPNSVKKLGTFWSYRSIPSPLHRLPISENRNLLLEGDTKLVDHLKVGLLEFQTQTADFVSWFRFPLISAFWGTVSDPDKSVDETHSRRMMPEPAARTLVLNLYMAWPQKPIRVWSSADTPAKPWRICTISKPYLQNPTCKPFNAGPWIPSLKLSLLPL